MGKRERERHRQREREREQASIRNDVWNTSEMLSNLDGCPSLNPEQLHFLCFPREGTNATAHINPPCKHAEDSSPG